MVDGNLATTNLLLGIMAAVSVIEAVLLVAVGIMAWKLYTQTMQAVKEIEQRQVAPLVARVNVLMAQVDDILVDVKGITSRVGHQTERVNSAITTTFDRVDETAERVRSSVTHRVNRVLGVMHGVRSVVSTFFSGHSRRATT